MMKTKEAKTKKSKELEDDDEYDYIKVPPDGGFGWVVLIACFVINMIIDGFLYAFGAISDDLKQHFVCQEWAVSLVISIACSCYSLSAPLASALCNKWGCRSITMIGGIIAGLSVAASVYAPSIRIMWLLFDFIGGIGMGLVYLPSIVMVGYYFEKKRAIATGIVTAGTGIGSIIFGPFSRFLFDKLGWKYGLLVLACILSGCTLCAAFMRPLKPIRKRRILEPMQPSDANSGSAPSNYINVIVVLQLVCLTHLIQHVEIAKQNRQQLNYLRNELNTVINKLKLIVEEKLLTIKHEQNLIEQVKQFLNTPNSTIEELQNSFEQINQAIISNCSEEIILKVEPLLTNMEECSYIREHDMKNTNLNDHGSSTNVIPNLMDTILSNIIDPFWKVPCPFINGPSSECCQKSLKKIPCAYRFIQFDRLKFHLERYHHVDNRHALKIVNNFKTMRAKHDTVSISQILSIQSEE
ncbi:unnamed protein product [Rotaria sordida]|uniref:Uncharacterized protein n=1 Tax=Rotaria sordida TaxID=392033 RepID=A0A814YTB4_9BILA|nr:unnamed protein product [Rotaria sordida]